MLSDDLAFIVYKSRDYAKAIQWVPKLLLGSLLLWPGIKNRFLPIIGIVVILSAGTITVIGIVMYIMTNIKQFNKAAYAMCLVMVPLLAMARLSIIFYKRRELEDLLNDIDRKFWPYDIAGDETKIYLRRCYKTVVICMIFFFIWGSSYVALYTLVPFFMSERALPYLCDLPNWNKSPIYEVLYLSQYILIHFGELHGIMGSDYLICVIGETLANQYRILQTCFLAFNTEEMISINDNLKKIDNDFEGKYDVKKEYFVRCVRHHDLLLRFTKKMNEVLSPLELFQLSWTSFAVCLGLFILSRPDTSKIQYIMSVIYIIGISFQLVIDCWIGTDLYYQATMIPDCIFKSNWIAIEDQQFKKDIMFAIQHAQRYPIFTAYNLYDMNMASYARVLKVAFSIYTLLTKVTG